jgi:putative GTP pyrophosphokinase
MPEVESRVGANTVDQVLAEFDDRRNHFASICKDTKRLIEKILEQRKVSFQSVQARVKAREKLKTKYCNPEKDYKRLDDIPDLVGLRIITYYSDKIDQIAAIIAGEFSQLGDPEDKRTGKPDTFGYSGIHHDCAYSAARLERTEYEQFADARFEIQVTTILGHAWAEMHHPWYDDLNSPAEEIRRFHRLAAVLELAEQEFLEIRKKKDNRERIASVRVAAKAPEIPITPESLRAFVEDEAVAALNDRLATILGGTISKGIPEMGKSAALAIEAGMPTIQALEDNLGVWNDAILDFVTRSVPIWNAVRPEGPRSVSVID